jgi:hypothetical protein
MSDSISVLEPKTDRRLMPVAGSGGFLLKLPEDPENPATWRFSGRRSTIKLHPSHDRLRVDQPVLIRVKPMKAKIRATQPRLSAAAKFTDPNYRPKFPGPTFREERIAVADRKVLDTSSITSRQGYLRKQCARIGHNRSDSVLRYLTLIDQMLERCPEKPVMRSRVQTLASESGRRDAAVKTLAHLQREYDRTSSAKKRKAIKAEVERLSDLLGYAREQGGVFISPLGLAMQDGCDEFGRKVVKRVNIAVSAASGTGLAKDD